MLGISYKATTISERVIERRQEVVRDHHFQGDERAHNFCVLAEDVYK